MSKATDNNTPKLTRREAGSLALIGALAASTAGFPVAAKASAAPDAELQALFAKAQELKAKQDAAFDHVEKIADAYLGDVPPVPERAEKWPRELAEMFNAMKFAEFRRLPDDHPIKVWEYKTEAAYQEKYAAYRAAARCADAKHGMSAAEDAASECVRELSDFAAEEIFSRAAESLAGMLIKVRTIKLLAYDDGLTDDDYHWSSLMDDITELAKKAGVSA